jgi:hypothetical protein
MQIPEVTKRNPYFCRSRGRIPLTRRGDVFPRWWQKPEARKIGGSGTSLARRQWVKGGCLREGAGTAGLPSTPELPCAPGQLRLGARTGPLLTRIQNDGRPGLSTEVLSAPFPSLRQRFDPLHPLPAPRPPDKISDSFFSHDNLRISRRDGESYVGRPASIEPVRTVRGPKPAGLRAPVVSPVAGGAASLGAVSVSDRASSPAASRPKLSASAALATGTTIPNRIRFADAILIPEA